MRIGIDIDNTILDYSEAFVEEARLLPGLEKVRKSTKADLKSIVTTCLGKEEWTLLQGRVYSRVPSGVEIYSGFSEVLRTLVDAGHHVSYMSHKSRYPILGPQIELRKPVTDYLYAKQLISHSETLVTLRFFETKEEKIQAIIDAGFDFYIDDLREILVSVEPACETIHFACGCNSAASHLGFSDWRSIAAFLAPNL